MSPRPNTYNEIIEWIFFQHHRDGATELAWDRGEIGAACRVLGLTEPKNHGDVPYRYRYRYAFPQSILDTQPTGMEWVIRSVGRSQYKFVLLPEVRIVPNPHLITTKIPDATPNIILTHSLADEQALLALVRYNRLIDIFLGITTYSLQNHLRTTVANMGQIEVDEVYLGLDKFGAAFVIPVQAKGGSDHIGRVQIEQDLAMCSEKFPDLQARSIAVQFMTDDVIAMFELAPHNDTVGVVQERHYKLTTYDHIDESDMDHYAQQSRAHSHY